MLKPHIYISSWKNDGEPHMRDAMERAIGEAKSQLFGTGQEELIYKWSEINVKKLPCDAQEDHYPDLCCHYEITITP